MASLRVTYSIILVITLAFIPQFKANKTDSRSPQKYEFSLYSNPGVELTKLGDHLYYFSNETVNWFAAERFCRSIRLDLVAYETSEEHNLVSDYIFSLNITKAYETYWTGGSDLAKSGDFYWSMHGQPLTFTLWRSNMPNVSNNYHCLAAQNINKQYFRWINAECNKKAYFVCEK